MQHVEWKHSKLCPGKYAKLKPDPKEYRNFGSLRFMGLAYDGVVKKQLFFIEFNLYQVLLL